MAEPDLSSTIAEAAAGPASVRTDSTTIEGQPLKDLIAADEYLAKKRAGTKKHRGIGIIRQIPPGTV